LKRLAAISLGAALAAAPLRVRHKAVLLRRRASGVDVKEAGAPA
jgi:hypothetical protein